MKFNTMKQAMRYAKSETIKTGKKHKAVKSQYLSLNTFEFIECFCVVLCVIRGRA